MTLTTGTNFDVARADVLLKQVYADKIVDMVPQAFHLGEDIPFIEGDKQNGNTYHQPVNLAMELGLTFNSTGDVFDLNQPQSPQPLDALINGAEIVNRVAMSYGILNRAMKGDTDTRGGMRAFINATKYKMKALIEGASFAREAVLLYGGGAGVGSALATVLTVQSAVTTTLVINIDVGDWATALWVSSKGVELDIYTAGGTKRNLSGSGATLVFKLTAVDIVNYRLTFTSDAGNVSIVAAGDQLFFAGSRTKDMLGYIGACQSASTFWNIDPVANPLWKPQRTTVSGTLSFEAIMQGCTKVADIGFEGLLNVYVSPGGWQDLADDQAAMVSYASKSNGKVRLGFQELRFYSQTGEVAIKTHKLMKRGMALGLPDGECFRMGSTDITTNMPGVGKMVRELENKAGVEARVYTDQAAFCQKPAFMHLWEGIQNSTR